MNKRKDLMPDGRRYIVYYTFNDAENREETTVKSERRATGPSTLNPQLSTDSVGMSGNE